MPSDLFSFSHTRNSARLDDSRLGALRDASESTEGLMATVTEQLGKKRTRRPVPCSGDDQLDPAQRVGADVHARIGIGLPMSNIYARQEIFTFTFLVRHWTVVTETRNRYFGGSLELVSLDGWGTYRRIRMVLSLLIVRLTNTCRHRCVCPITEAGMSCLLRIH